MTTESVEQLINRLTKERDHAVERMRELEKEIEKIKRDIRTEWIL